MYQVPMSGNPKRDDIDKMHALYEATNLLEVLTYAVQRGYKPTRIWQVECSGRNGCIEVTKEGARAGTITSYELGGRIVYTLFGTERADTNELKIHPLYTLQNKLEAQKYRVEWLESESEALKISCAGEANGLTSSLLMSVFGTRLKSIGVLWMNDEERNATRGDTWVFDYFEEDAKVTEILQKEAERRGIKLALAQRLKQYCP